jgi:hypothetical protein
MNVAFEFVQDLAGKLADLVNPPPVMSIQFGFDSLDVVIWPDQKRLGITIASSGGTGRRA